MACVLGRGVCAVDCQSYECRRRHDAGELRWGTCVVGVRTELGPVVGVQMCKGSKGDAWAAGSADERMCMTVYPTPYPCGPACAAVVSVALPSCGGWPFGPSCHIGGAKIVLCRMDARILASLHESRAVVGLHACTCVRIHAPYSFF